MNFYIHHYFVSSSVVYFSKNVQAAIFVYITSTMSKLSPRHPEPHRKSVTSKRGLHITENVDERNAKQRRSIGDATISALMWDNPHGTNAIDTSILTISMQLQMVSVQAGEPPEYSSTAPGNLEAHSETKDHTDSPFIRLQSIPSVHTSTFNTVDILHQHRDKPLHESAVDSRHANSLHQLIPDGSISSALLL
jgi:hypothetical protein